MGLELGRREREREEGDESHDESLHFDLSCGEEACRVTVTRTRGLATDFISCTSKVCCVNTYVCTSGSYSVLLA